MQTLFKFLDGKKTVIAAIAGTILSWAETRGYVAGDTATMLDGILTLWTGVAIGHKLVKAKKPA